MRWSGETLTELATAYWRSATLMAGVECGLAEALPGSAVEVAGKLKTDPRVTEMLLEAWAAMGLAVTNGEVYHLEPSAKPLLLAGGSTSMVEALRLNRGMAGFWARLPELVKTGRPVVAAGEHLGPSAERTRQFVMGMHSRGLSLLPAVAEAMDLEGVETLLDVGSGPGTLGRMLCERWPGLEVMLVDLPAVTEIARELTVGHPAQTRVRHVAGDYEREALPVRAGGFDAAVYCGALHQHADVARVLRKVVDSVKPGAKVFVVDLMLNDGRDGPEVSALFALNMALVSPVSRVHSVGAVVKALEGAGVEELASEPVGGGMYVVVSGVKARTPGVDDDAILSETPIPQTVVDGA